VAKSGLVNVDDHMSFLLADLKKYINNGILKSYYISIFIYLHCLGHTIFDSNTNSMIQMNVAITGVLGDLPGRSLLFGLCTSFGNTHRPCHVCKASREELPAKNCHLRDTKSVKETGKDMKKMLDNGKENSKDYANKHYVSLDKTLLTFEKDTGVVTSSVLFDYGVPIEACVDDIMHTKLAGTLGREWKQFMEEIVSPNGKAHLVNKRAQVYPYTKLQENVDKIATELPGI
jgi:hypothetical protein